MTIITCTVQKTKLLTEDTILLMLQPHVNFKYQAGDYLMMGVDSEELKPFSIASIPNPDGLIELHIRDQENTPFMHKLFKIKVGTELIITGPNTQYQLDAKLDKNIILIAGGTGFAPMKALLEQLIKNNFVHNIYFYWGASKQQDFYLHNEITALANKHKNLTYTEVLSQGTGDKPNKDKPNKIKLVHKQVLQDFNDLSTTRVYLCGAWGMISDAKIDFLKAGLLAENYN